MKNSTILPAHKMIFGMNRKTDEQSMISFMKRFADDTLLETLIPRLDDKEIEEILNLLSSIMGKHFREKEYHNLFLSDR